MNRGACGPVGAVGAPRRRLSFDGRVKFIDANLETIRGIEADPLKVGVRLCDPSVLGSYSTSS